jgi:acyl-CoA synthetase (AMP-forming)/AMP-acid ligase II
MQGLMQDVPLLISGLLEYADRWHPRSEIVTYFGNDRVHRYGFAEAAAGARKLASALRRADVTLGDRVATLAMNHNQHFELYFAVSGIDAVLHTVNPRLFEPQIEYVVRHGGGSCGFRRRRYALCF